MKNCRLIVIAAATLLAVGCGKKKEESTSGAGSYPNIYSTTKLAIPSFSTTALTGDNKFQKIVGSQFLAGTVPSTTSNFGAAADWTAVTSASSNTIGQLLRDAGMSGTIKSLWTLLSQTQGTIDSINTTWSDTNGEPTGCTALTAANTVTTPYWATATGSIVTISDAGKYKCYAQNNDATTVFGRHAITSPAASCTDAYEYYVITAYALAGVATSGTGTSYGATSDGGSVSRFYYHGCDKTLKLQLASFTKYSGGTEFSLRTEVVGNTGTSAFTMRSAWVDITSNGGGGLNSIVGSGTTFKVGSTNGSFLVGDLVGNCPTGTTCATPTGAYNYCIENTGAAATTMTVASANTTCTGNATLSAAYTGLTPITDATAGNTAGVPRSIFTVTKAAMNLP